MIACVVSSRLLQDFPSKGFLPYRDTRCLQIYVPFTQRSTRRDSCLVLADCSMNFKYRAPFCGASPLALMHSHVHNEIRTIRWWCLVKFSRCIASFATVSSFALSRSSANFTIRFARNLGLINIQALNAESKHARKVSKTSERHQIRKFYRNVQENDTKRDRNHRTLFKMLNSVSVQR